MIELRQAAAKIDFFENRSANVFKGTCAEEAQKKAICSPASRNSP